MHTKALLVGALAAAVVSAEAHGPASVVRRDDPSKTKKDHATKMQDMPNLQTVEASKLSSYHNDMHSLRAKIKADPMYTSMKAVMQTAVPPSYKDAMHTNPQSVHSKYKSTAPEWYKALPTDVKNFMESNRKAAKSVYEKDIGPVPTGQRFPGGGYIAAPSESGQKGAKPSKSSGDKKSEGPGVSVYGAAVCALVGAFGVAALLL